jgi:hypothetical protein
LQKITPSRRTIEIEKEKRRSQAAPPDFELMKNIARIAPEFPAANPASPRPAAAPFWTPQFYSQKRVF